MSSKECKRVFKLAFPFKFRRKDSDLIVIDRFSESHEINWEKLSEFDLISIDKDKFILFEVKYTKPTKPRKIARPRPLSPQAEAGVNGYTLFHSSVPKSKGHGTTKSNYEYYKREHDLSYYTLIKKENSNGNTKTKKVILGSLLESSSRIRQMASIINRNFDTKTVFDRNRLTNLTEFPSNLTNRRVLKSTLDVLREEGFLKHAEKPLKTKRGREIESFVKTEKLVQFIADPRSVLKPNGVNVGQRVLTSDQ